jgi:hypothetical protein
MGIWADFENLLKFLKWKAFSYVWDGHLIEIQTSRSSILVGLLSKSLSRQHNICSPSHLSKTFTEALIL